jgi:capsular exopolysaccharide synthesis family protein
VDSYPFGNPGGNLARKSPARQVNLPVSIGNSLPGRTYGPFVIAPLRQGFTPGPRPAPSLGDYLMLIYRHRLPILAFVAVCVLGAYFYARSLPRIYEASLIMDAEHQNQSMSVGVDPNANTPFDADQFIGTQIHMLQSDPVLRPVALKYRLLDEENQLKGMSPAEIARAKAAPIELSRLRVARQPNTYLIQVAYRSSKPELAADVVNAIAASYADHLEQTKLNGWKNLGAYTTQRLAELKGNMESSAAELQTLERSLGMVDPEDKSNIVASRLQQLNQEYARALTDRANKEAAYEAIRSGHPDAAQASPQAETLKALIDRRNLALQRFSDIKAIYGDGHPEYQRAQAQLKEIEEELANSRGTVVRRVEAEAQEARLKEANLRKEYDRAKASADRLANGSLPYRMLKQKADSSRALYDEFVRKLGEAEINTGVRKTGARLSEPARVPLSPVSPNVPLTCLIALVASSLLAVVAVVAVDAASNRLRGVPDVRAAAGHDVIGTLPPVKHWRGRKELPSVSGTDRLLPSNERDSLEASLYLEAVRMLRSSLMAQADRKGVQTILVTSPRSQEGRSTVASQLGAACSDLGLKTILIDGDLRRPSLQSLSLERRPLMGLSHVLKGEVRWQAAVTKLTGKPLLHVIPAGEPLPNGADLLSTGLPRLLEETGRQCDLVILDSAPLLESAQAIEMARAADAVLLVVRANRSDPASLRAAIAHLDRVEANVLGVVLNDYQEPRA